MTCSLSEWAQTSGNTLKPLPQPQEIKKAFPCTGDLLQSVGEKQRSASQVFAGQDPRLCIIVGPCSLHDEEAILDYALRFKKLAAAVESSCFLVMRAFFEKPRTLSGWKGILYDPLINGSHDMATGLYLTRQILWQLAKLDIPLCTELLEPLALPYFSDLISWGIIGARTSASQLHRQLASSLEIPVGFKNGIDGNLQSAIQGIAASQHPHAMFNIDETGKICHLQTSGNSYGHLILRGSLESSNYDLCSLQAAASSMQKLDIEPKIIIDCSHGNARKRPEGQIQAFRSSLSYLKQDQYPIMGLMLESHLGWGRQEFRTAKDLRYGVSITDPCIDWATTEELILEAAEIKSH